jgi:hypothetical protein
VEVERKALRKVKANRNKIQNGRFKLSASGIALNANAQRVAVKIKAEEPT